MGSHHKGLILVSDDIPAVIRLIQLELTIQGFEVARCLAEDALQIIHQRHPSLIVLDLPGLSGYELLKQLRARHASLPVMFLANEHNDVDRALAFDRGADDYITKPFAPVDLGRRAAALIDKALALTAKAWLDDLRST